MGGTSPNGALWGARGVAPEAWGACDAAMPEMLLAVKSLGADVASAVLAEAVFQMRDLPERTPEYVARARWAPASPDSAFEGGDAWVQRILLLQTTRPRKAMALLMFAIDDCIGRKDFAGADVLLASLPVQDLTLSLLVGALMITAPYDDRLKVRAGFFAAVRARTEADAPDRADRILSSLR